MRWTIARKLWLGFGLVLLVFVASCGLTLAAVHATSADFLRIAEVEEPISQAAYEMEINAIGAGDGVLKYLETRDRALLAGISSDEADFQRSKADYDRLAITPEARALGGQLTVLSEQYLQLGRELMDLKDRQSAEFAQLRNNFTTMDALLDDDIQAALRGTSPTARAQLQAATSLESDLAETGTWFGHYRRTREQADSDRLDDNVADFRGELAAFTALGLTPGEQRSTRELQRTFATTTGAMDEVLAADDAIRQGAERLGGLRGQMDGIIDDGIQALAQGNLLSARTGVEQALRRVVVTIIILLLAGVIAAVTAVMALTKGIVRPLRRLTDGADRIGKGDLDHEVTLCTTDEVGELASCFNQMTRRRRAAEHEAKQTREALEEQNERLLQLDHLKDDLVALVSHEFRTPLTAIIGYTEFVMEDPGLTSEQRHYLAVVERSGQRLQRLVGDLLVVAEIDAGNLRLQRSYCDLGQLARDCIEAAEVKALEKRVELSIVAERIGLLAGDCSRLAQVLDNLVSNAIKFTPNGGRVHIRVTQAGKHAVLEVSDTGIGIPAAEQRSVFARLFRTSTATERAIPGIGLGLWISKQIIEAHGGHISLSSTEGVGTTFRIELPANGAAPRRDTARDALASTALSINS